MLPSGRAEDASFSNKDLNACKILSASSSEKPVFPAIAG
jgi:hypothetical protein